MTTEGRSIVWSGIQVVSIKGASFVFSILIARLVVPDAYGLIAMITVFLAFFQLFVDSGLGNAIIQKKNASEIDYSTVFISNILIAIIVYIIMFISAPLIADFYGQPELNILIRWVSLSLIIQSFSLVQKSRLTILLDFKAQAKAGIIATLVSGVLGLILAYLGYGVWALVIQTLINQFTLTVCYAIYAKWLPSLSFSKTSFNTLFKYGSKDLVGNIFTSFFINIYNLVIGKFYSPASLAYYNRGFNLGLMPASMIQETISRISFPVMCRYQDDRDKLLNVYYKYISLNCYITFPIQLFLAVLAKPLVLVLLTEKWIEAAEFTSIMALAFMTYTVNACLIQVVNAIGKPEINVKALFPKRIIGLILLFITAFISVRAVAWGLFVGNIIELFISAYINSKELQISVKTQFYYMLKPFVASLIMSGFCIGMCLLFSDNYLKIISSLICAPIIYVTATFIFKMEERTVLEKLYRKILNGCQK